MLHKFVGQSEARHAGLIAVVAHPFEHRRAEASVAHAVFHGHHPAEPPAHLVQQLLVERLHEAHVVVSHRRRVMQRVDGFLHLHANRPHREHGHPAAVAQLAPLAHGHFLQRAAPVAQRPAAARIANDHRALAGQLGRIHQLPELMLVHGRGNRQVGNRPERRQVEGTVVRGPVFAHQPGPVQTDHHRQPQHGHVVDDVVVSPLRKGTIYVAERLQPVLRHAAREGHRMPLGNAHVERPLRQGLHHDVHRAARRHGRRHAHYARVLLCQFEQRVSKHLLEFRRPSLLVAHDALARVHVKLARRVPSRHVLHRRRIAMPLLRVQMQHLRPLHVLQLSQQPHQLHHVMAVEGPEVSDVHALKHVLLVRERALHGVAQSDDALAAVIVHHALRLQPLRGLEANGVIRLVGVQPQQILLHAAHAAVNRHVVVVQDNQQVVRTRRHVVQPLKGQSAAHRPVANHGHHAPPPPLVLVQLLAGHRHAQSRRDAVAGVPRGKRVVFALQRRGERAQAFQLPVGAEQLAAARQYLVAVGLVAHVPHYSVFRRVEHVVQRHRQLHGAQARRQVPRVHRQLVDDVLAQLLAQLRQLLHLQAAQVARQFYPVQQSELLFFSHFFLLRYVSRASLPAGGAGPSGPPILQSLRPLSPKPHNTTAKLRIKKQSSKRNTVFHHFSPPAPLHPGPIIRLFPAPCSDTPWLLRPRSSIMP